MNQGNTRVRTRDRVVVVVVVAVMIAAATATVSRPCGGTVVWAMGPTACMRQEYRRWSQRVKKILKTRNNRRDAARDSVIDSRLQATTGASGQPAARHPNGVQ